MSFSTVAARAARALFVTLVVALGANLTACGSQSGTSSDLPPGKPTKAPPGDLVLYAAMSLGNRIDAYRLGTDGLLPSKPFDTIFVDNPRRLALAGNVLYATLKDQIISIQLGSDGSMPDKPSSHSLTRSDYDPVGILVRDNVAYIA